MEDVRDPGAHEPLPGFPLFVGPDRLRRGSVDLRVGARERGGHPADGDGPAPEADRHQAPEDVGEERRGLDVHAEPIGPDRLGIPHDELEDAGLQIPAGGIEPRRIRAERVQHLLHLVHGGQRFDQRDGSDDGVPEEWQLVLTGVEKVPVPGGLFGRLELWEVEVDPLPAVGLRPAGEEEGQGGPEDRGGNGGAVHGDLGLVQVEPPLPVHEERKLALGDPVLLAPFPVEVGQLAVDG